MDLDQYLDEFRLRALYELIMGRPQSSRWREALLNSEGYAENLARERMAEEKRRRAAQEPEPEEAGYAPALHEYKLEHAMLSHLIVLIGTIARGLGVEAEAEDLAFPGPVNPIEEARARLEQEEEEDQIAFSLSFLIQQSIKPKEE